MTSSWTEVARDSSSREADEHALVLTAAGIPSGSAYAFGQHVLLVREDDAERARAELARYARENPPGLPVEAAVPSLMGSAVAAAAYVVLLLALDAAQRRHAFGWDWRAAGAAAAGAIRDGQVWRSVTALFLHVDLLHLASNLAFGALFGVMLGASVGFGAAWLSFVATGAAGNLANAWIQSPSHTSIGASTAIFGMLGVQVAHDWIGRRRKHGNVFRRWAPIAIGAMVLAWLGGGGAQEAGLPKIDVWSHVLGFAFGVALGGALSGILPRLAVAGKAQAVLAVLAAAATIAAWVFALRVV